MANANKNIQLIISFMRLKLSRLTIMLQPKLLTLLKELQIISPEGCNV